MIIRSFRCAVFASACIAATLPTTASAQIWIGQIVGDMMAQEQAAAREHACMTGEPMPAEEVTEARDPALQTMTGYFATAKTGDADLSRHFNLDKRSRWTSGTTSVGMVGIATQVDPFATAGLTLDGTPLAFVRAGDAQSALGQWVVRDAAGAVAGTYTAGFSRRAGVWRLSTLVLTSARTYVDPVVQYCHAQGDVMPYRLANSRAVRERAEKRVAKAKIKADQALASGATARARADKSPGSATARDAALKAEARARQLSEALEARSKELADAQATEATALADAKTADDAKAAAIAALGG